MNTTAIADSLKWEEQIRFLGIKLINVNDFTDLLIRLLINTAILIVIVHFIYAKRSQRKDFYFSYLAIGVIVFFICFLLNSVKLEIGFALGLFAIFGIIRYRTDPIPIKEMTYLFIIIGISVINSLANKKVSYAELVMTNTLILFGLWWLERLLMLRQEESVQLIYEKIENIQGKDRTVLLEDIKARSGIDISRYEIKRIDFLRDVAHIVLYYPVNGNNKIKEN